MDKNVEGISVIVSKLGGIEIKLCKENEHIEECRMEKDECRYHTADFIPLKKLGLCQEYYK